MSEIKPRTVELTICPPFDLASRNVQNSNHDVYILYLPHMADGVFLNPRGIEVPNRILRDTGSLQSILTSSLLPNWKGLDTSKCRFIKGVTGTEVKLPLVEVEIKSTLFSGKLLALFVRPNAISGKDACLSSSSFVVTRAMATEERNLNNDSKSISKVDRHHCHETRTIKRNLNKI